MEKKLRVRGGKRLFGAVEMSGAKNSAVALIPATVLVGAECFLENIPNIEDVNCLYGILSGFGGKICKTERGNIAIDTSGISKTTIMSISASESECESEGGIFSKMRSMRASYYMLGALLGKYGYAKIATPGGCAIGERPMDLHIDGMRALGAQVNACYVNGVLSTVEAFVPEGKRLKGDSIRLPIASVGATINIMLAAVCAEGMTIIENAAKEPHVIDVIQFLNKIAKKKIVFQSTDQSKIYINGIDPTEFSGYPEKMAFDVVADQIEAATYVLAAIGTGGAVDLVRMPVQHIRSLISELNALGAIKPVDETKTPLHIEAANKSEWEIPSRYTLVTAPYPKFPTDMQQPYVAFLSMVPGMSIVEERIFEARYKHVPELNKMGANIQYTSFEFGNRRSGTRFNITGVNRLTGTSVSASDLRAGAALIVAAIMADGETVISSIDYILRGYEDIVGKLRKLGADVELIEE